MILGRSPALWVGLVAALLNVAVVVLGLNLTDVQLAALNGLALIVVSIVANESDPRTVSTFAGTTQPKAP